MHVIHGELRKPPFIKQGCGQDGQSTMFILELSEVIRDNRTGEKSYTNYSACLFAKSQAHVAHYHNTLVEGNFVVVTGDKLKIDISECGKYTKLQVENARLEGSKYIESNQNQGGFQQQPQQQTPPQQGLPPNQQGWGQPQQQGGFQQQAPQQQGGYQQGK